MRNTKQRDIILDIINNSYEHLTAYEVYELARKRIPNISLGTVYRNLSFLTDFDRIRKLEIAGIDRFDRNTSHAHFICSECSGITDVFETILITDEYIDGNLVMNYDIKINGICQKCLKGR